jgi:hypothetical protein
MIVKRKKNEDLDQIMFSEDLDGGAEDKDIQDSCDGEEEVTVGHGNKKKKRLSKGAKPRREIAEDGSLYRFSITYFLQELCPHVSQLGTNLLAVELGAAGFLHEPIYNKLASVCNNSMHGLLKSFVLNHDIYVTSGVQKEAPATFDELSVLAVLQGMEFINTTPKPGDGKYSPETTSRLTHIVQTGQTFYYTTTISLNVATKSCLVWQFRSCLTV